MRLSRSPFISNEPAFMRELFVNRRLGGNGWHIDATGDENSIRVPGILEWLSMVDVFVCSIGRHPSKSVRCDVWTQNESWTTQVLRSLSAEYQRQMCRIFSRAYSSAGWWRILVRESFIDICWFNQRFAAVESERWSFVVQFHQIEFVYVFGRNRPVFRFFVVSSMHPWGLVFETVKFCRREQLVELYCTGLATMTIQDKLSSMYVWKTILVHALSSKQDRHLYRLVPPWLILLPWHQQFNPEREVSWPKSKTRNKLEHLKTTSPCGVKCHDDVR